MCMVQCRLLCRLKTPCSCRFKCIANDNGVATLIMCLRSRWRRSVVRIVVNCSYIEVKSYGECEVPFRPIWSVVVVLAVVVVVWGGGIGIVDEWTRIVNIHSATYRCKTLCTLLIESSSHVVLGVVSQLELDETSLVLAYPAVSVHD